MLHNVTRVPSINITKVVIYLIQLYTEYVSVMFSAIIKYASLEVVKAELTIKDLAFPSAVWKDMQHNVSHPASRSSPKFSGPRHSQHPALLELRQPLQHSESPGTHYAIILKHIFQCQTTGKHQLSSRQRHVYLFSVVQKPFPFAE